MAASVWNLIGWHKAKNINPKYICRFYRGNKRVGMVVKDKMHTVEQFLREYPNFESKIKPLGAHAGENITLKELLEKMNEKDPILDKPIDIGLPNIHRITPAILRARKVFVEKLKSDEVLEKAARTRTLKVSLNEVKEEWEQTDGLEQIKTIAEHYGIYKDLFDGAFFYPRLPLKIEFPLDEEYVTPVYRGNHIKPSEATTSPQVNFECDENTFWTLILTNLDGHLQDSSSEYLHWFMGNIPGNDLSKGEVICDYLQPFPAKGTGYHRFVFILYKQEKHIDYSELRKQTPCLSLKERTFKTFDFYSTRQDVLTPAGLAFFQSDWDESVKDVFHHKLVMREPVFEYEFPPLNIKPQQVFPGHVPFNTYLDKYRDPQEIAQEILIKRLKKVHPFQPEAPKLQFPNTVPVPPGTPAWLKTERFKEAVRIGKYRGLDMQIFKPERPQRPYLGIKRHEDGTEKKYSG